MAAVVTVNDVLDGHVVLDLECLDRIYVNGYVPNLQVGGQVASFLTQRIGSPIPLTSDPRGDQLGAAHMPCAASPPTTRSDGAVRQG